MKNAGHVTCVAALTLLGAAPLVADEDRNPLTLDLGDGVSVTLYGYVKADFISNRGFDLGNTASGLNSIGLPGGPAVGDFDRQILNESRIGFTVSGQDVFARFEGDFYGPNDTLRLRHAYVEWFGLMVGQNWTNYMSVETLSDIVEFQGAMAFPLARIPQVRYTFSPSDSWKVSASVEEDKGNRDDFAFTVAARYGFDNGMVRISGLWRDTVLGGTPVEGWGLTFATLLRPWEGGTVKATFTTGQGMSDYLSLPLSGNAVTVGGNAVGMNAAVLSVAHQVTQKFKIAATGSWVSLDTAAGVDTRSVDSLQLSAFYEVHKNTTLMAEYLTGTRKQGNGAAFDADRIQLALRYSF